MKKRKTAPKRKRLGKRFNPEPMPPEPKLRPFEELWDKIFVIDRTVGILTPWRR
jgi:hypothetical protein